MTSFAAFFPFAVVSTYLSVCLMIYATGSPMIGFAVAFLLLVAFTLLSGWIAARRGHSTTLWYWLGGILGPIALLAIALLPPVPEPPAGENLKIKPGWMIHITSFAAPLLLVVVTTYLSVCATIYSAGSPMIGFAAALLLLATFTLLSGWIAGQRGHSTKLWYWLGGIFGPTALVVIALLPPAPTPPAGEPR